MKNTRTEYAYKFGLLAIAIGTGVSLTGTFEGDVSSIFGFFIFLFVFLKVLDQTSLFKNIKNDLWVLVGYVASLVVLLYLFCPYGEHSAVLRPLWGKWYTKTLAAPGYAPGLILQGLREFFGAPIAYHLTKPRTHYPFALGFYLLFILLTITIKLYEKVSRRTQTPTLYLLLAYNFTLGAIVAIWMPAVGILVAGMSVAIFIPTHRNVKRRKHELQKQRQLKAAALKEQEEGRKDQAATSALEFEKHKLQQLAEIKKELDLD